MTTINAKAESFKNVFATAAVNYAQTKEQAQQNAEQAQSEEERETFAAAAKKADTHARYTEALSNMSEKALASLSKYKVNAEALAEQSRELKKRSIAILEALATKQRVNDRALDAVLQYIVKNDAAAMNLEQVRHQMQHDTLTQAQYFKTCAIFFNFAQYSKSEKTISFNKDAIVLKELIAIYSA
ncbi:hypothetical protein CNR34_00146 [Pseudomonas phage nickie]|uniref:Uncharacterized protein n=1 Tax=Pseudomonas phage nickie TaxID=2048977 RepID=A0A2H4P7D3_9CAUD|nr:hypothetical protein FDJ16_gp019 [Pseudomonas phage nickie]ATW58079.1 hypothetical protein CNR34_00146 [Pseudomonas phage nickie]